MELELFGSSLKVWRLHSSFPLLRKWWRGRVAGVFCHGSGAEAPVPWRPCPRLGLPIPGRPGREVSDFTADLQGKSGREGIR